MALALGYSTGHAAGLLSGEETLSEYDHITPHAQAVQKNIGTQLAAQLKGRSVVAIRSEIVRGIL
jgi:hypothetical protein